MAGIASLVVACACFASPLQAVATDYVGLVNAQLGAKKVGLGATAAQIKLAITAVVSDGSFATNESGALVSAVLAQMIQTDRTGANAKTLADAAIAGLETRANGAIPNANDLVGIATAVSSLTTTTAFKTTLDAYTAQKNVIVSAAKAGMIGGVAVPPSPVTLTPDMGVATALAAFVTGTANSFVVTSDTTTNTARRVDLLNNIFKSVPAATSPLVSQAFLASARNDAYAGIAGGLTGQAALSGSNAGELVGLLSGAGMADGDLRFVSKGAAGNLDITGKQDLAYQAAHQLKLGAALKETTKQALAIGVASAATSADDRGRIVGQVASTMANGDLGVLGNSVTGATPVDVRRATLAKTVLKALDYTQAPGVVASMLAVCPLSSDAGKLWNGSLTGVTIASKYTTTLMSAIPTIGTTVGKITLDQRSSAVRGATVSIVTPWDNADANLTLKVSVAQTVIVASTNRLFAPDIARDVAAEVFADSSWSGLNADALVAAKLAFAGKLATNITDINKGVVAAGLAAADTAIAGKIVRTVGDLGMGLTATHKDPTDLSRAKIANATILYLSGTTGTIDSNIMADIARTGASYASGTSAAVSRANFANQIVLALAKPTSALASYDAETPVSNAIAGSLISSGSATDAQAFVGALAKLQKVNGPRIGTLTTAMVQTFNGSGVSIQDLASTLAGNAPANTGTIATIASNYAAQTYGASSALAVGHSIASTPGVVAINGVPIFTAVANATSATVSGTDAKALLTGSAAQAVLSGYVVGTSGTVFTFQGKAGDMATAAGNLSYLDNAGKATVAGAMSASLVGSAAVTNAGNVAYNLCLATGTTVAAVPAKGDVTAAVLGNLNGITAVSTKTILVKVFPQLASGLDVKITFDRQLITDLNGTANGQMFVKTVSGGLASYTTGGIVATSAPDIAVALATGFGEQTQRWVAVGIAEAVTTQSSPVARAVLTLAQNDLAPTISGTLPNEGPNNRTTLYAGLGARFAQQFYTSTSTTVKKSSADIAGASAGAAAAGLSGGKMSEVAHEYGVAFANVGAINVGDGNALRITGTLANQAHNNLTQLINTNNSEYATAKGLAYTNAAGEISEEFAAIAVALTHQMTFATTSAITDLQNVIKVLVAIAPHAAPDILGVVLTDIISRAPAGSITAISPIVASLNTAATTAAVATNKTDRTNVLNAIFSGNNPYADAAYGWGNITGDETPIFNR